MVLPNHVLAVVVSFQPPLSQLRETLTSILSHPCQCLLIDNGSCPETQYQIDELCNSLGIEACLLNRNIGIAAAQNIGLQMAINQHFDYVWLSDQDTQYPQNFLETMLNSFQQPFPNTSPIAAVGPLFFDETRQNFHGFQRFSPWEKTLPVTGEVKTVSQLIASGMVISVPCLKKIGLKNPALFIDWVDFEWCWRAQHYGFSILGNESIVIHHQLGDQCRKIFGRYITLRNPMRHYFMVRNAIHLALYSPFLKPAMRTTLIFKALRWSAIYPLLAKRQKWQHLKSVLLGLIHGLMKRLSNVKH